MPSYIPRTLESHIRNATRQLPVVLLTGARQVGKTTLLRHLKEPQRDYVSLDDPVALSLAREDPALFMQRFPGPALIDEIQYAPQLLPHIKMAVDEKRVPGLFWLTGSQVFHLMQGVSESLAGRAAVIDLYGFSKDELNRRAEASQPFLPIPELVEGRSASIPAYGLKALYRLIWRGSLPAIALNPEMDWDLFYGSYVQTYLQRDVRHLARVGDEMAFLRFLRATAARTGQLLNQTDLARDADVAPNTARGWLSILQASGIVYLLGPYHSNLAKRLVKTPKLYFLDTGLCAYLTEWSSPETLEAGAMSGAMLETWVISELLKGYRHNGRQAPFFYYRDKDKKEIDLLIVRDGTVYPLEVKKTAMPGRRDVSHFRLLEKLGLPIGPGGVVCLTQRPLPLTANTCSIPIAGI